MCSSYAIIESLLADLMEEVTATEEVSNTSLELSFSSTPGHPLPCSADFQFFFSISVTAPPHSPDCGSSSTCSGVTPPPSPSPPPSPPLPAIYASPSPPSPGVPLLPLSGQMTQAVQQAHTITIHQQEVINSALILITQTSKDDHMKEGEPASKNIKLEVVDLLEDEIDADLELKQDDDIEKYNKASSDADDDRLPFNISADLRGNLQNAGILPAVSVITSQRPDGGLQLFSGFRVGRRKSGGPGVNGRDIIKQEGRGGMDTHEERVGVSKDEDSGVKEDGIVAEDRDGPPHDEKAVTREDGQPSRPSLTKISLLNKPPRLGLSKLYRSSTSLHDMTIVEAKDIKLKYQQEVFIIDKEE